MTRDTARDTGGLLSTTDMTEHQTNRTSFSGRRALSWASFFVLALTPFQGQAQNSDPIQTALELFKPYVVYGDDDRRDICQEKDAAKVERAASVAALVESRDISQASDGSYVLRTENFGTSYNLCPNERFVEQPVAAACTGFLVAPDLIVTAGHCVKSARHCTDALFVFDFKVDGKGQFANRLSADNVYHCQELLVSAAGESGNDFALIRLDRSVKDRRPLEFRTTGSVRSGDGLFVIGHPAGLPAKIAAGARVRAAHSGYFTANLDVYEGNSGSPVFNEQTGEVEGILVAGEEDFVQKGKCYVTNRCTDNGCQGEEVTAISALLPYLSPVTQP